MTKPSAPAVTDSLVLAEAAKGRWVVDTEAGEIRWAATGGRAEYAMPNGYGRLYLGRHDGRPRYAWAHRVVWLVACGPIPPNLEINHRNGRRWDNRLANLELVSHSGNALHARGSEYDSVAIDGTIDGPRPSQAWTGRDLFGALA